MADGIEEFNWERNLARVATGFKNNPFFSDPVLSPALTIGPSFPKEVEQKMQLGPTDQPTPTDPWVARYPSSKL